MWYGLMGTELWPRKMGRAPERGEGWWWWAHTSVSVLNAAQLQLLGSGTFCCIYLAIV